MWNLNNPFIPILSLPQYFLHCVSNALSLGEVKSQLAAIFPLCHLTCQGTALASPLLWVIPCLAEPAPIRGILWAQSCKKVSRLQISGLSSGTWYRRWRAGGRPTDAQLACAVLGMYETGPDEEYLTYYGIFSGLVTEKTSWMLLSSLFPLLLVLPISQLIFKLFSMACYLQNS